MTSENNTNKYTVEKEWSCLGVDSDLLEQKFKLELTEDEVRELASQLPEYKARHEAYNLGYSDALEENQKPKTVYDLDEGDGHHYMGPGGEVYENIWHEGDVDKDIRKQGNAALTPEPLERKARVREAVESIRKYKLENGLMFEPEHHLDTKYYVELKDNKQEFHVGNARNWTMDTQIGYFKTREDAREVIDNCREELEVIFNLE